MKIDPAVFLRQFRLWAFHCSLNALPSFLIALIWLELWRSPVAIAAMISAVATFVVLYTVATSLGTALSDPRSIFSRALRIGLKIRCWISVGSVPVVLMPGWATLSPDLWCGFYATQILEKIWQAAGGNFNLDYMSPSDPGFLPVFATTLLEGFILSFLLLLISFFGLIFVQAAARRKAFRHLLPPEKR